MNYRPSFLICLFFLVSSVSFGQGPMLDKIISNIDIDTNNIKHNFVSIAASPHDDNLWFVLIPEVRLMSEEEYWEADLHIILADNRNEIHSSVKLDSVIDSDAIALQHIRIDSYPYCFSDSRCGVGINLTYSNSSRAASVDKVVSWYIEYAASRRMSQVFDLPTSEHVSFGAGMTCVNTEVQETKASLSLSPYYGQGSHCDIEVITEDKSYILDVECNETEVIELINIKRYTFLNGYYRLQN